MGQIFRRAASPNTTLENAIETQLHNAVSTGNVDDLERLIKDGADLNVKDSEDNTPLHKAVECNQAKVLETLIKNGANLEIPNDRALTPLYLATNKGHTELMKLLIKSGANVHNQDKQGNTGGHKAAFNGQLEVVQILLENWFNVNIINNKKYTLLHFAARGNFLHVIDLLVEYGAEVDAKSRNGDTPIMLAARLGQDDALLKLHNLGAKQVIEEDGRSVLHMAAKGNRFHTVHSIMTMPSGFDKSMLKLKWDGGTPEDYASKCGSNIIAWYLNKQLDDSSSGCYIHQHEKCRNAYEKSGSNIIKRAGMLKSRESNWIVKSIMEGDIEMHYMDEEGNTMLHTAAATNNSLTVQKLLEVGTLTVAQNYNNQTALDIAEQKDNAEISELLRPQTTIPVPVSNKTKASALYSKILYIITNSAGLDTFQGGKLDKVVQKMRIETQQYVGKKFLEGVSHDPTGSHERHLLSLAITTNNRTLLPLLLAAGLPLTAMDLGLGIVELAWHTDEITTWVGMVVTRNVVHRLQMEQNFQDGSNDNLGFILNQCTAKLVEHLKGEKPWRARFTYPKSVSLDELLIKACRNGATITAWYIWKTGANLFQRGGSENATALEAALSQRKLDTATRLVVDMGANAFLRNSEGRVLINKFSQVDYLLEVLLGQEYRRLEKCFLKAKEEHEKLKFQQLIILHMILYFQYLKHDPNGETKWKPFLGGILQVHFQTVEQKTNGDTNWMLHLRNALEDEPEIHDSSQIASDGFYCLYTPMLQQFNNFTLDELDTENTSDIDKLLKEALLISSEQHLSMFLHLLISIAGLDPDSTVNEVCLTTPLHHAAAFGNLSAVAYLLECGASATKTDRCGNLPTEYASMNGHKRISKYISEIGNHNDTSTIAYSDAYLTYMNQYGLNQEKYMKSRFKHVKTHDKLLKDRLNILLKIWSKTGIRKALTNITIDYTMEEAQEVRQSVMDLLTVLKNKIADFNEIFAGHLECVGSSEDNVRLYCPDEYDCNLVLKNITGYPNGGLSISLTDLNESDAFHKGYEQRLEVHFNENLQKLMKGSSFLDEFYGIAKEAMKSLDFQNTKLKLILPGIKRTQVGVALSLLWLGEKYKMLLVDVDFVPTVRAPWPDDLPKPIYGSLCSDLTQVFLNSIGNDEWRFSFGQAETQIMTNLTHEKREVFLACKMILSSLKTEKWVPKNVKNKYEYWCGRFYTLPSKGGFVLKNSFFRELEDVRDDYEWEGKHLLKRMNSIFQRMCKIAEADTISKNETVVAKPVKAYFGGVTEKANTFSCAPEILAYIRRMDDSVIKSKKFSKLTLLIPLFFVAVGSSFFCLRNVFLW